ncbi:unnamed protein product, partial [Ectocarpus sp. 12 AP-2014]
ESNALVLQGVILSGVVVRSHGTKNGGRKKGTQRGDPPLVDRRRQRPEPRNVHAAVNKRRRRAAPWPNKTFFLFTSRNCAPLPTLAGSRPSVTLIFLLKQHTGGGSQTPKTRRNHEQRKQRPRINKASRLEIEIYRRLSTICQLTVHILPRDARKNSATINSRHVH